MQLQFASDLHLEFHENRYYLRDNPLEIAGDILLLAGDILPLRTMERYGDFFNFLADNFSHTYWLPGNHEYYDFDIANRSGAFKESILPNVTLLNDQTVTIGDIRLHFSTLWSAISASKARTIERSLNDFHLIRFEGKRLSVDEYNRMHNDSLIFLEDALQNNHSKDKTDIVITHHVPTFRHYPLQYKDSPINQAFATDMDSFIESYNAKFWIFGHHHAAIDDFAIGNTTLMTNQLGYVHANENKAFDHGRTVELK
ncbi:metallophosphoesterase [Mucilaginibacter gynuensis]|uniref:Metallophosphoesterase n=1 Tax=Mucilaginibacter gynuensis TaxID=1302236 RepID=A0ABP8HDI1_9SPHI